LRCQPETGTFCMTIIVLHRSVSKSRLYGVVYSHEYLTGE
jgi:hypothetical protein